MRQLTMGSLFAGIGGFDLGFERAGFEIVWEVEIDEYCRRVLERHFPRAERFSDIRDCGAHNLKWVDVISGGFPCQDISVAGKRAGIDGSRSGLWSEMRRVICELRPRFVVVENVAALLYGGIERVVGELAESGYDTEWDCLPASAFGAPHRRDRCFIVADASSPRGRRGIMPNGSGKKLTHRSSTLANSISEFTRRNGQRWASGAGWWEREPAEALQDAGERGRQEDGLPIAESLLGRVANGIPNRVDRLRGLGNAVVPQIAQWIAERIKATQEGVSRD